jgi:D-xylose transport system substrate-binding protein
MRTFLRYPRRGEVSRKRRSRGRSVMVALSLTGALAATAAGCSSVNAGSGSGSGSASAGKHLTIGAVFSETLVSRWKFDEAGFTAEVRKLGDTPIVVSAQSSEQTQRSEVENMITKGVNALVIAPVNVEDAASLFQLASSAHIPVIDYNFIVPNIPASYIIARNAVQFGQVSAQQALGAHPSGNYVIIGGDPGNSVAIDTTQGNSEGLASAVRAGKVHVVSQQYNANWSPQTAQQQIEEALVRYHNNIAAVLSNNDGMAVGVLQALKSQNLLGRVFVSGVDGDLPNVQAIAQGSQSVTMWTDFTQMGSYAAQAADAAARGKQLNLPSAILSNQPDGNRSIPTINMPTIVVDKANLCGWVNKYHYYTAAQVYGSTAATACPSS